MSKYGIISKGLSVTRLRKDKSIYRYLYNGFIFSNKDAANFYLDTVDYQISKNLKVVKIEGK